MNQLRQGKKYKEKCLRDDRNYFTLYLKSTVPESAKISTLPKKKISEGKKAGTKLFSLYIHTYTFFKNGTQEIYP